MRLAALFLIPFLLFSCTTFTSSEGPQWTRETPNPSGALAFVDYGDGTDDASARSLAYRAILEDVSEGLGYDAVNEHLRELLQRDAIAALEARIVSTYTTPLSNGVRYYAMLEIPEEAYYQNRSAALSAAIERDGEISRLLDAALDSYRDNRDTETVSLILEALDISLTGSYGTYNPEELLEMALGYLRNISIRVRGDGSSTAEVILRRSRGVFNPAVDAGSVVAEYTMVNGEGEEITSSVTFQTADNGHAVFRKTNPYTLFEGAIEFRIGLSEDTLRSIESKADPGFLDPLHELVTEKSVHYSYIERWKTPPDRTVIGVAEYGEDGVQRDTTIALEAVAGYLERAKAGGFDVVRAEGDEEEDALAMLREAYPGLDSYILLRVGVVDRERGIGLDYSRTEGRISIYGSEGMDATSTHEVYSVAAGVGERDADDASILQSALSAAGLLLADL